MRNVFAAVATAVLVGLAPTPGNTAPTWSFVLDSAPGAFIGAGKSYAYLNQAGPIGISTASFFLTDGPNSIRVVHNTLSPTIPVFSVHISSFGLGESLHEGNYPDAERFSDPGHPGLDVGFDHRGANSAIGEFRIYELEFHQQGTLDGRPLFEIDRLSFTFVEFSEGGPFPISGAFAYNAPLASAIPEPASTFMVVTGIAYLIRHRRRHTPT
jgi:hypothetical protein